MFLAFNITDIITVPFGYLLDWLYTFTSNYGVALILFSLVVKVVLFPIQAKSKKSTMKSSRLTPLIQDIQARYPNDKNKQAEEMQRLYKEEGVSMTGGCLWGFVPLLILLPLYSVVRQPIVYMLHESWDVANKIVEIIKDAAPAYFNNNSYYYQMVAASHIPEFAEEIKAAVQVSADTLKGVNFNFLGVDLGAVPQFNVFAWDKWDWAHIGSFLLPCLSAGGQVLSMFISQKMNNSLVTDENGLQDEETAKKSQANQSMKIMLWMMPLMSLWIGFTIPAALSLYWLVQGIFSTVQDVYLTKRYRKIYDAEDAERLKRKLEQDRIEAEKERVRAERRAANPDGITENTSKKKLQKTQQQRSDAAKAAAAKEYAAKKGITLDENEGDKPLSGIAERPYCKGRAYDPDRYSRANTEE